MQDFLSLPDQPPVDFNAAGTTGLDDALRPDGSLPGFDDQGNLTNLSTLVSIVPEPVE